MNIYEAVNTYQKAKEMLAWCEQYNEKMKKEMKNAAITRTETQKTNERRI